MSNRIGLRVVISIVGAVAALMGFVIYRVHTISSSEGAVHNLRSRGCQVSYVDNRSSTLNWISKIWAGPDKIECVSFERIPVGRLDLDCLSVLKDVDKVCLIGDHIVDETLREVVRAAPNTKWLMLSQSSVRNEGLAAIGDLRSLETLFLNNNHQINSLDYWPTSRLPRLYSVDLSYTSIDDRSLAILCQLPAVEEIDLQGTDATDVLVKGLRQCFPRAVITDP